MCAVVALYHNKILGEYNERVEMKAGQLGRVVSGVQIQWMSWTG